MATRGTILGGGLVGFVTQARKYLTEEELRTTNVAVPEGHRATDEKPEGHSINRMVQVRLLPATPNSTRKYLTEAELKRLLAAIRDPRDKAIFTVAYWRGLRASEVGKLQLTSWQQEENRMYIERLKGSSAGEYPLSPEETKSLRAWVKIRGKKPGPLFISRQGRGIGRKMLDVLMRKYSALADIPAWLRHFHVLKHSCGTHRIGDGEDIYVVKDWLGHREVKSTEVYAQFRNKDRDEAASRVYERRR